MDKRIKIFGINFGILVAYTVMSVLLTKNAEDAGPSFMVLMTLLFVVQSVVCFVIGLVLHFRKDRYQSKSYFLTAALMLGLGLVLMMAGGMAMG